MAHYALLTASVPSTLFIYLHFLSLLLGCSPRGQASGLILVWISHSVAQGMGSAGHIVAKSDLLSITMAIQLSRTLLEILKFLLLTEKGHLPTLDLPLNGSNLKCGRVEDHIPWGLQWDGLIHGNNVALPRAELVHIINEISHQWKQIYRTGCLSS